MPYSCNKDGKCEITCNECSSGGTGGTQGTGGTLGTGVDTGGSTTGTYMS